MDKKNRIGMLFMQSTNGESYGCYIPKPLPPNPPIQMERFYGLLDKATSSIGKLNGVKAKLPDIFLFHSTFVKKEAVLSLQIEGTQSSVSDFLLFENSKDLKNKDNRENIEIENYIDAMEYGLKRIKKLPLSRRCLCEIHEKLLANSRGSERSPGEFRTSQNWIGGTRPGNAVFVPPPVHELTKCFGDLEKFLNNEKIFLPVLIKIAMAHVQFETIHPFLDGNGRLGRLLVTFMLCVSGLLEEPLLYLSLYFKKHKKEYYRLLQSVRETGDWESWIEFFLSGIYEVSCQAIGTADRIVNLFEEDEKKIKTSNKDKVGVLRTYEYLKKYPISSVKEIKEETGCSPNTVFRALKDLKELGLVKEFTEKRRNKIFFYKEYLDIIESE